MWLRMTLVAVFAASLGCNTVRPAASPLGGTREKAVAGTSEVAAAAGTESRVGGTPLAEYDRGRVSIVATGKKPDFVLVQNGAPLTEVEFRKVYRRVVGTDDLERDAWSRARRNNAKAVAMASGFTVVGIGGLVWVAASKEPAGCPNCAKAVVGSTLFTGVGLYALGCEVVKGARCILDGNFGFAGAGLSRQAAAYFVDQYNAALVRSLARPEPLNRESTGNNGDS
jgi:hypothetical protein